MIMNDKKNKIKDTYSPFRRKETFEMIEYRFFILFFFFTILYHLLDCKMVLTDFE